MEQPVRVGIVGAGANTRERHIPGFRALPGVEIVGVVNRTPDSTARAAAELGIPRTFSSWQDLVADPAIDAVCIGTWPYLHCDVSCAALAAGKHVLTEARMARNAAEAHRMLAASRAQPELVAQIVPSPFGLGHDDYVRQLLERNYLGELRELVLIGADASWWDYSKPLHWRQDADLSGYNVLTLGILHETALRWAPPPVRVFAQTALFEPLRPHPTEQRNATVTVPDSVQVLTQLANGGRGLYHFSGVDLLGPGLQVHLYGSGGTIKLQMNAGREEVYCGRLGDAELRKLELPESERGGWRVEAEFIGAIRGHEKVRYTDFATGVKYMEFVEAVARSAAANAPIALPLAEFDPQ